MARPTAFTPHKCWQGVLFLLALLLFVAPGWAHPGSDGAARRAAVEYTGQPHTFPLHTISLPDAAAMSGDVRIPCCPEGPPHTVPNPCCAVGGCAASVAAVPALAAEGPRAPMLRAVLSPAASRTVQGLGTLPPLPPPRSASAAITG